MFRNSVTTPSRQHFHCLAKASRGRLMMTAVLCAAVLLGGCASYGYGGYGGYGGGYYDDRPVGYYGSSAYDYGYGGYGYGGYAGYGYPYGSYYGSPYGYGRYYGGHRGGYPPYYHQPRPPQNNPRPPVAGEIGIPPPWRDQERRMRRLSGEQVPPPAGDRQIVMPPSRGDQGSRRSTLSIGQPPMRSEGFRAEPRMERPAPRVERQAPPMQGGDAFRGRRERDGGPDLTP